jgi:hypothetical protein
MHGHSAEGLQVDRKTSTTFRAAGAAQLLNDSWELEASQARKAATPVVTVMDLDGSGHSRSRRDQSRVPLHKGPETQRAHQMNAT